MRVDKGICRSFKNMCSGLRLMCAISGIHTGVSRYKKYEQTSLKNVHGVVNMCRSLREMYEVRGTRESVRNMQTTDRKEIHADVS